jgi:hypothetical protein
VRQKANHTVKEEIKLSNLVINQVMNDDSKFDDQKELSLQDEITGLQSAQDKDAYWLKHIYQGDKIPQLTFRAVLIGGILGAVMSISNLYTTLKVGWSFGVAITACVISFVVWNTLCRIIPKLTPMSILENNCMQSTASAAGYSTGATIGTALGALLLISGQHVQWQTVMIWTLITACIGVFLANDQPRAASFSKRYCRCRDPAQPLRAQQRSNASSLCFAFSHAGWWYHWLFVQG